MAGSELNLTHISQKSSEPDINKLRDAAAARKQARESSRTIGTRIPSSYLYDDEYWIPSRQALPASTDNSSSSRVVSKPLQTNERKETDYQIYEKDRRKRNSIELGIPVVAAVARGSGYFPSDRHKVQCHKQQLKKNDKI